MSRPGATSYFCVASADRKQIMKKLVALAILCSSLSAAAQTVQSPPSATASTPPPGPLQGPVSPPEFETGQHCESSYYPPTAVRLHSVRPTFLSIKIAVDGSVRDATVTQSSGYDVLDRYAAQCISSSWHFKPAIQDGQPVEFVKKYAIVWRLNGTHQHTADPVHN
jgi:TonB family protein